MLFIKRVLDPRDFFGDFVDAFLNRFDVRMQVGKKGVLCFRESFDPVRLPRELLKDCVLTR